MSDQSIYLEHFQLHRDPFKQDPDPETFFSGAGREVMLQRLQADIESGKPLIKLTGSDGVGKTLLYLMLAQRLSPYTFDLVCLDHPVGSFEDLLSLICHSLRRGPQGETVAPQSYLPEFKEHLKQRGEKQRKVILIIDEAEKLFLATLERLVRLICDTDEGNVLHILLIGRPELEKNIDQLVIYCSNVDVNAQYVLEPLTLSETEQYLLFRLQAAGTQSDKSQTILDKNAVSFIYQGAMGNISLTNMLAEKGLKMACDAGMFTVDGTMLNPQQRKSRGVVAGLVQSADRLGRCKLWLFFVVAAVLVVTLVALWLESEQGVLVDVADVQVEQLDNLTGQIEQSGEVPVQSDVLPRPGKQIRSVEAESVQEKELHTTEMKKKGETGSRYPDLAEMVTAPSTDVEDASGAVVLQPESKKRKGAEPVAVKKLTVPGGSRNPDELFLERLRASSSWLAWAYRGGYTIQLMVLASEKAEESLKSLLVKDDFYAVRKDLYILRKSSSPTLLVFYGLYDTMEEARRIRDSLPHFLRKNQPYALSINEALEKIEK